MKPNVQIITRAVLIITGLTMGFILVGQGCGGGFSSSSSGGGSFGLGACNATGSTANAVDKNYNILPGQYTVAISYGNQLLDSLVSCTGIGLPSQRTLDEFTARSQSLSEYGNLTEASPASLMATAAIAGEICRDLIDKEKPLAANNRGIFNAVNLDGSSLSSTEVDTISDRLALSCWQRPASSEEKQEIASSIAQLGANSDASALGLCTAMLASLASIEQ